MDEQGFCQMLLEKVLCGADGLFHVDFVFGGPVEEDTVQVQGVVADLYREFEILDGAVAVFLFEGEFVGAKGISSFKVAYGIVLDAVAKVGGVLELDDDVLVRNLGVVPESQETIGGNAVVASHVGFDLADFGRAYHVAIFVQTVFVNLAVIGRGVYSVRPAAAVVPAGHQCQSD